MSETKDGISIWFFIGALLLVYGILIFGAGIYNIYLPQAKPVVLHELHAAVWWGLFLVLFGGFYTWKFRPGKI